MTHPSDIYELFPEGNPHFSEYVPKKYFFFGVFPQEILRNIMKQMMRKTVHIKVSVGTSSKLGKFWRKYFNGGLRWTLHQYQFCQTMNSNFIFWSISWRCTELPKSLQFKIKIKWTQNEKVDKNKKYCLKKYFNFVDCTLTVDFSNLPFDMKPG